MEEVSEIKVSGGEIITVTNSNGDFPSVSLYYKPDNKESWFLIGFLESPDYDDKENLNLYVYADYEDENFTHKIVFNKEKITKVID